MPEIYLTYEEACAAACIGCKRGDRLAKGRLHDDGRTRYVTDSDNEHEDHYYPCTAPTREQWVAGLAYEVRLLRRLLHVVDETLIAKVVDERNALRDEVSGLRENIAELWFAAYCAALSGLTSDLPCDEAHDQKHASLAADAALEAFLKRWPSYNGMAD